MNTEKTFIQRERIHKKNEVPQWRLAKKSMKKHWQFYLLIIPPVLYFIIFKYIPMVGAIIAFKDYSVIKGIWGSQWVGLKHFDAFFSNPVAMDLIKNTLLLSIYQLVVGFPIPIILALMLNEIRNGVFKRSVQMITYAPYFISVVIIVSIITMVLHPRIGIVNSIIGIFGMDPINFMGNNEMFRSIFVWSDVWQNSGYAAIIYLAALAGIDPQQYEAAKVDGASRFQRIMNVDIPGIMPAAIIILILNVGNLMAIGFEKVYLLQNPLNLSASEVLQTYVYKMGILNANFSLASAVGLFNSMINLILLVVVNAIAKRISGNSLW
ncbi:ABC transporter permease [Litchfieldia alkalitelluris]|uniref:ABC transporter permease n=1 Tax=Litchfieldia alkalitelluris TaxID=304268 RepID=UPI000997A776|nr:ABC transporter permease subunit [Litchfieldia alkalitelluris]